MMKLPYKKIISLWTLLTFLAQPGYGMTVSGGVLPHAENPIAASFRIELPDELGKVEILHAGSGPVLVHIQEAHGDPAIQKRIEQILAHLKKNYGFTQVFLEGSAFSCDRGLLNFLPDDPKVTLSAARKLMKQGLVSGPENFLLKNPDVSLSGVEDLEAYKKNSGSFYRVLKQKEKTAGFLKSMDDQMDRLAGAYLHRDLRDFIKQVKAFDEERLSLQALLVFIAPQMKKMLKADLEKSESQIDWPMLVRLSLLDRWQREFDAVKFEQERKAFVGAVQRFLPKKLEVGSWKLEVKKESVSKSSNFELPTSNSILGRLEAFLSQTNVAQSTGITDIEPLIEELVNQLPSNFDYARYPQVIRRVGMAILQNEMKGETLMNEIDRALRQLEDRLAAELIEKETVALLRDYRLTVKLLKLEWTRREYENESHKIQDTRQRKKIAKNPPTRLNPSSLAARAVELNTEGRVKDVKFEHVKDLEQLYREAFYFYQGAEAREEAMSASVERQMQGSGDPKAVLITGGFHAAPLGKFFNEKNWNYALITPAISEVHARDSYIESLLQNYYPGTEARAGLRDIPYATTPLREAFALARNPAVYLAHTAAALSNLSVSRELINRTEVMRQLPRDIVLTQTRRGLQVQLDPKQDEPFIFDAKGQLKKQPSVQFVSHWNEWVEGVFRENRRSEVRMLLDSQNVPLAGGMEELISRISSNWPQIKQRGFFVFDMQKTLVARKAVATPQMIELLAWLIEEGVEVVINSGNSDKEVMDQVIDPLRSFLQKTDKAGWLSKVVVFANSGTLMVAFDAVTGAAKPNHEYQHQMRLPMIVAETLKLVLERLAKDKFGLPPEQLEELKKMYELETQKSKGVLTFDLPWLTGGVYDAPIKFFPEEVQGQIQGPYVQLRSPVEGLPTKIAVTKFIPGMRKKVIEQIKSAILNAAGPEVLEALDITVGGDSTIDITSLRANKALAIKAYVERRSAQGLVTNPEHIYVHGDELTGAVEGVVTAATHEGNDLRMLRAFEDLVGVAATPKPPVGLGKDAARTYFLGTVQADGTVSAIEEKGVEIYLGKLRAAISARSEVRAEPLDPMPAVQSEEQILPYLRQQLDLYGMSALNTIDVTSNLLLIKIKFGSKPALRAVRLLKRERPEQLPDQTVVDEAILMARLRLLSEGENELLKRPDPIPNTMQMWLLGELHQGGFVTGAWNAINGGQTIGMQWIQGQMEAFKQNRLDWPLFLYLILKDQESAPDWLGAALNQWKPALFPTANVMEIGKERYAEAHLEIFTRRMQNLIDAEGLPRYKTLLKLLTGEWVELLYSAGWVLLEHPLAAPVIERLGQSWAKYFESRFIEWLTRWQAEPKALLELTSPLRFEWIGFAWEYHSMPPALREHLSEDLRQALPSFFDQSRMEAFIRDSGNLADAAPLADDTDEGTAKSEVRTVPAESADDGVLTGEEARQLLSKWRSQHPLDKKLILIDGPMGSGKSTFSRGAAASTAYRPIEDDKHYNQFYHLHKHEYSDFMTLNQAYVREIVLPALTRILSVRSDVVYEGMGVVGYVKAVQRELIANLQSPLEVAIVSAEKKPDQQHVYSVEFQTWAVAQRSEVRSIFDEEDPLSRLKKGGRNPLSSGLGDILASLSSAGLNLKVIGPDFFEKQSSDLFKGLPEWMAKGAAVEAWNSKILRQGPLEEDEFESLIKIIKDKMTAQGVSDDEDLARLLKHLRKVKKTIFDEQRWALKEKNISSLIAYADKGQVSFGRGALVNLAFAAEVLFRAGVISFTQSLKDKPAETFARVLAAKVFPDEGSFYNEAAAFTSLSEPEYLDDAIRRFDYFEKDGLYHQTKDLLMAWLKFDIEQDRANAEAHFAVLEQAGFLMKKLWPIFNTKERQLEPETADAFARIAYPFLTFVMARHEFFRDARIPYQKAEEDVARSAVDFMKVAEWVQLKVEDADQFPPVRLPRHPDDSIDADVQTDAADLVVRAMMRANDQFYNPMDPSVPEAARLTYDKVFKSMWEEAEDRYRKGELVYYVQPPLVMFSNPGEILTPESGNRFVESENQLAKLILSNLTWLRQAMTSYGSTPERNETPSVAAEGFITEKTELEFSEVNPVLMTFSHIHNDGELIFTDNVQASAGIWLGMPRLLSSKVIDLDAKPEPTPLRLLVGGETAVSSRLAQPREVAYHQSSTQGLSILVHKNAVISELIDWNNGKLRSPQRDNPFDRTIRGRWMALIRAGTELYKNPNYEHAYFSPQSGDLSAWADDILSLRDSAESSYWRTIRHFMGNIQIEDSSNPQAGRLELYNLLRNQDSVFGLLAQKLAHKPGTTRLTQEAARAVINTLIALTWSGVPRSSLIYITPMIVLEAFEQFIAIHPDGISVEDLEGFKQMLTGEQSSHPILSRRPEDYGAWEVKSVFQERLKTYHDSNAWEQFDFEGRSFLPPSVDPATGRAEKALLRAKFQPSWYDAEEFPAEHLLYPDLWPAWNSSGERQSEWVGTYTEQGLNLPGTKMTYYFDSEKNVKVGDLLKVVVTKRPDSEPSQLKVRIYPYTEMADPSARSEVRSASREDVSRRYELIWDYFSRKTDPHEETAAIMQAVPLDKDLIKAASERLKQLAEKSLERMEDVNISRAQGGFSAVINVLRLMETMDISEFPEIRTLDEVSDPAFFLAQAERNMVYISKELMANPEQQALADFMLFLAAIDANRLMEDWDAATKRHIMEIAQDMFDPWSDLASQHESYVSKGLTLLELDLSEAVSPQSLSESHWQKRPLWESMTMIDLAAQRDMAGEDHWDEAADLMQLPKIQYSEKNDTAYRVSGGPNGLFYFYAEKVPVALDIPSLSEKNVIFRPLRNESSWVEIEVYSEEKELLGKVSLNSSKGAYESDSAAVRVLSPLQATVAHLHPKTTLEYQNVRTLAAQLSRFQKSGRGYDRLDFLEMESPEDSAKVQIDAAHGIIYLTRSLLGNEALAAELVEKALHTQDPIVMRQDLMRLYQQLPVLAELESGKPLLEKNAAAFYKAQPIPELLADPSHDLIKAWPKDKARLYDQLNEHLAEMKSQLQMQRTMDLHYIRNLSRYNPDRKGISHAKFRGWLAEALKQGGDEFFFTFMDKGMQSQTTRLDSLKWDENKEHTYRPFNGIGIATAEYFIRDLGGRFKLGRGGHNPDSTRYLFIRYPQSQVKDETLVDVFDLASGAPIQDEQIEYEKLRAEVASAMDQLIKQADNKEETRMDLYGLRQRLDDFIENLVFSTAFVTKYKREKPQENLDKLLLKNKADVLGVLNQLLATVLNSKDYSNALNFAVLEMMLHYIAKEGADQAKGYSEKLLSAYRLKPERLLESLSVYLMEEWKDFDPAPPQSPVDPNAERIQDFLNRVLLPISDWTHGQANDLTSKIFVDDTVFGATLDATRTEIVKQADAFLAAQNPGELQEGVMAFESRFREQYEPVPFMFRDRAPMITPLEKYLIESIFQAKQETLREINSAQAAERATYHTQYGAAEGIGASSMGVGYKDVFVLVDAGSQIDNKNTPPNWQVFKKNPAGVFITHDHVDHVGALIKLLRDHLKRKEPVYMTQGSAESLPHVLSFLIDQSEGGGRPAFTPQEIEDVMRLVYALELGQWYEVAPGMKIYFHGPVGHLHGAASLIVSTPDATTFISGDISYRAQGPVPGWKDIPEEIRRHIDRAVIESTYGMRTRTDEDKEEALLRSFAETTLAKGGKFLLPAFANGRSQRGLYVFLDLLENIKRLPMQDDLKIYVDGQAGWFTLLYLNAYAEAFRKAAPWMLENLIIIPNRRWPVASLAELYEKMPNLKDLVTVKLDVREPSWVERRHRTERAGYVWLSDNLREEAMERNEKQPTLIISSSGNATKGRSHRWAARLANNPLNGIAFVGYMDPQEAGSDLLSFAEQNRMTKSEALKTYFFDEIGPVPVLATIKSFGLSGHISGEDMMQILGTFGPALKEVIIQHGGDRQRREVFDWIRENHPEWGPRLIKNNVRYQGALPLSLTALAERKSFFDSRNAKPLPNLAAKTAPARQPALLIEAGRSAAREPSQIADSIPNTPLPTADDLASLGEFLPPITGADSTSSKRTVLSRGTEPVESEPVPISVSIPSTDASAVSTPAAAATVEGGAEGSPTRVTAKKVEKKIPKAVPVAKKPVKKKGPRKTKKPDTSALVTQLQTSKTIVNAIGKLQDKDLKILAVLIDALPADSVELVIEKNKKHEAWRGKLSDAARAKLEAEFQRRGLSRSEVRTETSSVKAGQRTFIESLEASNTYHSFSDFIRRERIGAGHEAVIIGTGAVANPGFILAAHGAVVRSVDVSREGQHVEKINLKRAQPAILAAGGQYEMIRPVNYLDVLLSESSQKIVFAENFLDDPRFPDAKTDLLAKMLHDLEPQGFLFLSFLGADQFNEDWVQSQAGRWGVELEKVSNVAFPDFMNASASHVVFQLKSKAAGVLPAFRSEVRTESKPLPPENKLRDRKMTELRRAEVRQEQKRGEKLERFVRNTFTGGILPLNWSEAAVLAELQRAGSRAAESFKTALGSSYPQLLRAARRITEGELERKIIDQRSELPAVEEMVPILALLNARSSLSYVLVSGAGEDAAAVFREQLGAYLQTAEVWKQWGRIDLRELADRFRIETVEFTGPQVDETSLKMAVMAHVLSGKQHGVKSAVVAESQALSSDLVQDAERYRFLNLYTPTGIGSTALVWMSAELLDELTDDLLAQFDNQALMRDLRWRGLWSEMQKLLAVRASA